MSDERIEKIQSLISAGSGDLGRLNHILKSIKEGKILFSSDQKYLDNLIEKHLTRESKVEVPLSSKEKKIETNQPEENLDKVQELQKKVKALEEKVEKKDISDSWKQEHYKSLGITAVVAFLGGFILLGLGHFYVGKKRSGIGWLIGGIILAIVGGGAYLLGGDIAGLGFGGLYLALNIIQTLHAVDYSKQWNMAVSQGIIPW